MKNQFRFKIRELREANDLFSQRSLAEKLGVVQSTIGNWESGTREPPFDKLLDIAQTFGVTTDYLLGYQLVSASNPDVEIDMPYVAKLREENKFSINDLAEKISVSPEEIRKIEAGKANPPANILIKLSEALGSSPSNLLGYFWIGDSGASPDLSPISFSDSALLRTCHKAGTEALTVIDALGQLNAEGREKLLDYAADLVASGNYKKHDSDQLGKEA